MANSPDAVAQGIAKGELAEPLAWTHQNTRTRDRQSLAAVKPVEDPVSNWDTQLLAFLMRGTTPATELTAISHYIKQSDSRFTYPQLNDAIRRWPEYTPQASEHRTGIPWTPNPGLLVAEWARQLFGRPKTLTLADLIVMEAHFEDTSDKRAKPIRWL